MSSDRALQERFERLASRGEPRGASTVFARAEATLGMEDARPVDHARRPRPVSFVAAGVAVLAAIVAIVFLLTTRTGGDHVTNPSDTRYQGDGLVLEDTTHGPELCAGFIRTLLLQCTGIPLTNWSWEGLPGVERRGTTTSGSFHVVGTYDGNVLRVDRTSAPARPQPDPFDPDFSPACAHPIVVDPNVGVAEWEAATQDVPPLHVPKLVAMWTSQSGKFVVNAVVRPGAGGETTRRIRARWPGYLCVLERDRPTEAKLNAVSESLPRVLGQPVWETSTDHSQGVVYAVINVVDAAARKAVDRTFGRGVVVLRGVLTPVR